MEYKEKLEYLLEERNEILRDLKKELSEQMRLSKTARLKLVNMVIKLHRQNKP